MPNTSEWTGWVSTTTDPDPALSVGASPWTEWVEATTDANPNVEPYRQVRRAGGWVAITDRQVRRSGVWG